MHAERLNFIAKEIVGSFDDFSIPAHLESMINAARRRVENPSQAYDEALSTETKNLFEKLQEMYLNDLTPTSRKLMEELGLDALLPDHIRNSVEAAIQKRVFDSDLVVALTDIEGDVTHTLKYVRDLHDAMENLGIGEDDVKPGQVEFDIAMPRESIADDVGGFGKLLEQLNRQLLVLSNITKAKQQPLTINSIATNDFTVAVNINVDLGDIIAYSLLGLMVLRKSYQEKKDLIGGEILKELPAKLYDQFVAWANEHVKGEIEKIVERLPNECPDSVDRKKLENHKKAVTEALRYMAEKQELGFNMEVRTSSIEETAGKDADEKKVAVIEQRKARIAKITARSAQLKVLTKQEAPILKLTDGAATEEG